MEEARGSHGCRVEVDPVGVWGQIEGQMDRRKSGPEHSELGPIVGSSIEHGKAQGYV